MILARRILLPTLVLFTILLVVLLGYGYITYQSSNIEEEQRVVLSLDKSFDSEIDNQEKIALSLALEVANNLQVQEAFASQDRARLLEVTAPTLERMRQFNVTQMQFHNPPAVSFLRVHNPDSYGDDVSGYRPLVVDVNSTQQPLVGIESSASGLGVRGITPVYYLGRYIGSLEIGIDIGNTMLKHLVEEYGNEWHILLTQEILLTTTPDTLPNYQDGPITDLLLYATTNADPVFNEPQAYTRALNGENFIQRTDINGRNYAILSSPISDRSGNTIGVLDIAVDRTDLVAVQNTRLVVGGVAGLLVLILGGLGITLVTTRSLQPISILTSAATEISSGNLSARITATTKDEIGDLSTAFNNMAVQVRESIGTLEQRVSERTNDLERRTLELETISDVAREISILRNMDTLLNVSVNLIRERFNYYHTGIYLVDERGESAVLQAASGAAAQQMIEQRIKIRVSEIGPLGSALQAGHPYVAAEVSKDEILPRNPLLPDTKSEIILPLRVLNATIGALDIQTSQATAFEERNIRSLQLLADQLAAAIENAKLVQRVEGTLSELNKSHRSQTQKAWQTTFGEREISSYEYDGQQIRPIPQNLPDELMKLLESGKAFVLQETARHSPNKGETQNTLLVPLMIFNQLIGVIGLEQDDRNHNWTNEEIAIAEAAANRAALTLENARLLEESQRRAIKERTISESTARIGTALNIENILDIAAEELERVLGSSEVILQINTEARAPTER